MAGVDSSLEHPGGSAIILSGDTLNRMDPARLKQMATSLASLLNVEATIIPVETAAENNPAPAFTAQSEENAPFSLVIAFDEGPSATGGWQRHVAFAQNHAPGVIATSAARDVKGGLSALYYAHKRGIPKSLSGLFETHLGRDTPQWAGSEKYPDRVHGLTFLRPQDLIRQPELLQGIPFMGKKRGEALGQFLAAATATTATVGQNQSSER